MAHHLRRCGSLLSWTNRNTAARAPQTAQPRYRNEANGAAPAHLGSPLPPGDCESGGLSGNAARLGSARPCCAYARRWDRTG